MKAKVVADFRDAATWELHEAGTEYEGTEERVAELEAKGFVKPDGGKADSEGKPDEGKDEDKPEKTAKPKAKAKKD